MARPIPLPSSHWLHDFPHVTFSVMEFYNLIEENLRERNMPVGDFSRVNFSESGFFSTRREYLRVKNDYLTFDICASPFGNGFFVSWWYGEYLTPMQEIVYKIPLIGRWVKRENEHKTYYQMDTDAMFKEAVRSAVNEAIEKMTKAKGVRALSDFELQPIEQK